MDRSWTARGQLVALDFDLLGGGRHLDFSRGFRNLSRNLGVGRGTLVLRRCGGHLDLGRFSSRCLDFSMGIRNLSGWDSGQILVMYVDRGLSMGNRDLDLSGGVPLPSGIFSSGRNLVSSWDLSSRGLHGTFSMGNEARPRGDLKQVFSSPRNLGKGFLVLRRSGRNFDLSRYGGGFGLRVCGGNLGLSGDCDLDLSRSCSWSLGFGRCGRVGLRPQSE